MKKTKGPRNECILLAMFIMSMAGLVCSLVGINHIDKYCNTEETEATIEYFSPEEETGEILPATRSFVKKEETVEMTTEENEEEFYDSLEMLAYCVMAEAGNQPEEGKRLVIDCVLNRVDSQYFPDTVEDVIMQKDPVQFDVAYNGTLYKWDPTEDIYQLIREEIEERTNDKVIYFTAGRYNTSGESWEKVGDHYFSYIAKKYQ